MQPGNFRCDVSGNGDDVDHDKLRKAFATFVRGARKAGFAVNGALTGQIDATRSDGGELVPAQAIHDLAGDVEDGK